MLTAETDTSQGLFIETLLFEVIEKDLVLLAFTL